MSVAERADTFNRRFRKIADFRTDGGSQASILRKFARRWGMREDSVQRYLSSPESVRYRRIRDPDRQRSVARIFNRLKREEEGFYYDLIVGRGQKVDVTRFAVPSIPDPPDLYPDVFGDLTYFKEEMKGNVWKKRLPRILLRTPGRGKRRMGVIKASFLATVESGDPLFPYPTELMSVSGRAVESGSTFGDLGDRRLGIKKPKRDLSITFNRLIIERYELATGRNYRIIRIIFDPKVARQVFPDDETAGQCNITILNAVARTELVRDVAGEVQYRKDRSPKTRMLGWEDVTRRLK